MAKPRVLILRAPGTNCDLETAHAFELAGGQTESIHIYRLIEQPAALRDFQILCLPGGFSYGDDLAAGRVLATKLQRHLRDLMHEFRAADKLILGICNGFQVLLKSDLLLAPDAEGSPATLTWNEGGKFEDRWVRLHAGAGKCVFLRDIETMELPIAHAEGKFVPRDSAALAALRRGGNLVLRYCGQNGAAGREQGLLPFPINPNGSLDNVAGICDDSGRVFGLMPHPERHLDYTHHPQWTRRTTQPPAGDGLAVFRNAISYFA